MKKIFAIFFLLIFLFNLTGYYLAFKIMQYTARREIKALIKHDIPDNELEKIIISDEVVNSGSAEFRFIDEKEFKFNNKLYDIVRTEKTGGNSVFYCINDKKEELLFAGLNDHIKRHTDSNSPARDKSERIVKNIIREALPDSENSSMDIISSTVSYSDRTSIPVPVFLAVIFPPPEA